MDGKKITSFTKLRSFPVIAVILFALAASILISISQAAGNASFSISPSSGSFNKNTNFTVTISENSGSEPVNTVDAKLAYDQTKLQLLSVSSDGSPFPGCVEATGGNGHISIVCAKLGSSVSGVQIVGKATFKAIAGSGTTALSFEPESHIYSSTDSSDIWNGDASGPTYSLKTPANTTGSSKPAVSNSSSNSSGGSGSSQTTSTSGSTRVPTGSNASNSADGPAKQSKTTVTTSNQPVSNLTPIPTTFAQETAESSKINPMIIGIPVVILIIVGGSAILYKEYFRSRFSFSRLFVSSQKPHMKPENIIKKNETSNAIDKIPYPKTPTPGSKVHPNSDETLDVLEQKYASDAKKPKH
jgi:hypothetical protein